MDLIEAIRHRLSPAALALLKADIEGPGEVDYEAVIRRVAARVKKDEELVDFARSRAVLRYKDLADLPAGRRQTLLRNSSPILLLVYFRHLLADSYEERFGDLKRSLELAGLALELAEAIVKSAYLSPRDSADLLAEAQCYLANARRINSDLPGAAQSLQMAEARLAQGTGDREVRADYLNFLAALRVDEGKCVEAAQILDQELPLRRLLGDQGKLGFALVQRGWVACMILDKPIPEVVEYFHAAMPLIESPSLALQAAHTVAFLLAREGLGPVALEILGTVKTPMLLAGSERFHTQHRWIRGIAYRTLGELKEAERELRRVRKELVESDAAYRCAIAGLDLAAVHAAQGKLEEVRQLAAEAYAVFKAEGLEERALTAVLVLQDALAAERVTEGLAVAVANFLARFPYNKALRFEWKGE